mmetsp:Transcript_29300/g.43222  ORF Transcript_29300/g.43222 Transcript_29300/m.43222 type:complete len:430 (-) Transcript_29300:109-1398(-)
MEEVATTNSSSNNNSPRHFRRRTINHGNDDSLGRNSQPFRNSIRHSQKARRVTMVLWGISAVFAMSTLSMLVARNFGVVEVNNNNPADAHFISSRRLGVKSAHVHVGDTPIQTIYLSDSVRNELYSHLTKMQVDTSQLSYLNSFIQDAKEVLQNYLEPSVLHSLRQLHNTSSSISAIQFRNCPVDPYVPPNPSDGVTLNKPTFVAEALLVALGELSGAHVIGYASETGYSNPWIHEGFPRKDGTKGSALTKASELSFHQDMSYTDPPDLLGLVCVREGYDHQVQTELLDIRELLETLPEAIVSVLQQPRFQIKTSSWVDASASKNSDQAVPLLRNQYSLSLPVDWENMIALDMPAQQALELLRSAILSGDAPIHYVHFVEGDLVLFSNVRVVHARTPYTDLRLDGYDRVMYRSYFKKDLTVTQRQSRMI